MSAMNEPVYPNVQRNDWFDSHDYTLWLNESTQMRLTPEQYACLKSSVDRTEAEAPKDASWLRAEVARAKARSAEVPERARPSIRRPI